MKYKVFALALVAFIGVQAQEENKDKIVETKTRIINVMEDGEMIQKKVMVKTTKEQEIKTDPNYKGTIDAPRVFPATKVSKVIYIDNDDDPFYDKETRVTYYKKDGMTYNFNPTNSGFEIVDSKTNKTIGNARFSANSEVYILDSKDYSGIGYFDNNMFVVEYYDDEGTLIIEKFNDSKL
ncbi:hypothetical protein [Winogradskyella luteola]|uniref:Uncharacterized protein n=1 Tax=Winogradskyella luteola TaxID=2828330 RepID=A0A9X1JP16_9FLAO|nr:hypothetical protein [Winogradskyella luteola]MBV7268254.1 hypothetical protein [Winogradskyella luteola]